MKIKSWYFQPSPNVPENGGGMVVYVSMLTEPTLLPEPSLERERSGNSRKTDCYWEGGIRRVQRQGDMVENALLVWGPRPVQLHISGECNVRSPQCQKAAQRVHGGTQNVGSHISWSHPSFPG